MRDGIVLVESGRQEQAHRSNGWTIASAARPGRGHLRCEPARVNRKPRLKGQSRSPP